MKGISRDGFPSEWGKQGLRIPEAVLGEEGRARVWILLSVTLSPSDQRLHPFALVVASAMETMRS